MTGYRLLAPALALLLLSACVSTGNEPAQPQADSPAPPVQSDPDLAALIEQGDAAGLQAVFRGRELADKPGADGRYPLHVAAFKKAPEMVEILLAMGAQPDPLDRDGKTPLRYAVDAQDSRSARSLVAKGASLYAMDAEGISPLDAAIRSGFIAGLLDKQSVQARNSKGQQPLHIACERLSLEGVRAILALEPDVSSRSDDGRTPLDFAFAHPGSPVAAAIAELLVSRNAASSTDEFSYFVRAVRDTNYARARFAEGATVLHEAVRFGHLGFLQFFLERGVPVDARNASGASALHDAMRLGAMGAATMLLDKGADPNAKDGAGNTVLHLALPSSGARLAMDMLLARGADPSVKDRFGNTSLHLAVSLGYSPSAVETLMAKGAPVDATNADGDTALTLATRRRNVELMPVLIGRGASIFVRNLRGETPLSLAFAEGPEAVKALVGPAPRDVRDDSGDSPYHHAVRLSAPPAAIAVLKELGLDPSARNAEGDSALHLAVRQSARAQGEALLAAGADPFGQSAAGVSPLTLALIAQGGPPEWFFTPAVLSGQDGGGNGPMHYAAMAALPDGVRYLSRKKVPADASNKEGRTPLMLALRMDSVPTVNALLSLGADPGKRDLSGASALHLGVYWRAHACLQLLLEKTKAVDIRDYTGKTALRDAVDQGDMAAMELILGFGANPLARDNSGETPLHAAARRSDAPTLEALAARAETLDARDDGGATPLLEAVYAERLDLARLLADKGASIHAKDAVGESPLSFAIRRGAQSLKALLSPRTVRVSDADGRSVLRVILDTKPALDLVALALDSGAPLSDRDSRGRSPLHIAVASGQLEIIALLSGRGADPFARDADGTTPAALALQSGERIIGALFGASPDQTDYLGETALHYAAASGMEKGALSLLALGADKGRRNALGETPADVALRRGYPALAELLKP